MNKSVLIKNPLKTLALQNASFKTMLIPKSRVAQRKSDLHRPKEDTVADLRKRFLIGAHLTTWPAKRTLTSSPVVNRLLKQLRLHCANFMNTANGSSEID